MEKQAAQMVELVNRWADYVQDRPDATLADFCLYYLTEHGATLPVRHQSESSADEQWLTSVTEKKLESLTDIRPEARLGALVGRLERYAHLYSKKAMAPLGFKSIEDPVYLILLAQMGTPKKSELINEMLSEFPSGIDIIKRLLGMGYAEEFPDEHDRRSKRLRITEIGMTVLWQCFPEMDKVADMAFGTLSAGEKAVLVHLLDKLERYHAGHYKTTRTATFADAHALLTGGGVD